MVESISGSDRLRVFFAGLAASVVSKGVSATLNAPVERSRMLLQLQGFPGHIPRAQRYSGVVSALGRIPREQGVAALWRGNLASVLRAAPPYCLNAVLAGRYKALFPRYSSATDYWKWFVTNIASGALAGAMSLLLVYPLDLAYTLMALDVGAGAARQFRGLRHCLATVYRHGGVGALYCGFGMSVAGIIVYRAVYFGAYDLVKQMLARGARRPSLFVSWLAATGVSAVAALATYPLSTVGRHLMMQAGAGTLAYAGAVDCARALFAAGGIWAFYGGVHVPLLNLVAAPVLSVLYSRAKTVLSA